MSRSRKSLRKPNHEDDLPTIPSKQSVNIIREQKVPKNISINQESETKHSTKYVDHEKKASNKRNTLTFEEYETEILNTVNDKKNKSKYGRRSIGFQRAKSQLLREFNPGINYNTQGMVNKQIDKEEIFMGKANHHGIENKYGRLKIPPKRMSEREPSKVRFSTQEAQERAYGVELPDNFSVI